jgi:hypothetical protein
MKHWDDRDAADCRPVRLSRAERKRLRAMFAERPAHRPAVRPHAGSVIGLALAVTVLAGLAWALAPADPVSSRLLP